MMPPVYRSQATSLLRLLIAVAVLVSLTGCVRQSVVPGAETYCFKTTHDPEFRNTFFSVPKSSYTYGPFKDYTLNANGGFGNLTQFYPLDVKWTFLDGSSDAVHIPVSELMQNLKTKDHWEGRPCPRLHLKLTKDALTLDYIISEEVELGPSPHGGIYITDRDIVYPVFHQPITRKLKD